jgi:hypothetical protein
MTECEQVTNQDAMKFVAGIQLRFMYEGNKESPTSVLETCIGFVQLQSIKRILQGKALSISPM